MSRSSSRPMTARGGTRLAGRADGSKRACLPLNSVSLIGYRGARQSGGVLNQEKVP